MLVEETNRNSRNSCVNSVCFNDKLHSMYTKTTPSLTTLEWRRCKSMKQLLLVLLLATMATTIPGRKLLEKRCCMNGHSHLLTVNASMQSLLDGELFSGNEEITRVYPFPSLALPCPPPTHTHKGSQDSATPFLDKSGNFVVC